MTVQPVLDHCPHCIASLTDMPPRHAHDFTYGNLPHPRDLQRRRMSPVHAALPQLLETGVEHLGQRALDLLPAHLRILPRPSPTERAFHCVR